jgi:hypothetical protein
VAILNFKLKELQNSIIVCIKMNQSVLKEALEKDEIAWSVTIVILNR